MFNNTQKNKQTTEFNQKMAEIAQQTAKMLQTFAAMQQKGAQSPQNATSELAPLKAAADAFAALAKNSAADPESLIEAQLDLYQQNLNLWAMMAEHLLKGNETAPPEVIAPDLGDRRFSHEEWTKNAIFSYIKQSYLLMCRWTLENITKNQDLTEKQRKTAEFWTKQQLDALAPTNFAFTNPEVMHKAIETNGQSLIKGFENLIADMQKGRLSMTDYTAFEVGKNLATTEGEVVFENKLMQLIQYAPKVAKTHQLPLLICPPWINKFYILDLQSENSFVKFCVEDCGLTTFIISWKNPDASYRDVGFEDYMQLGILEAINAVLEITAQAKLNLFGYCIGGTLLAATLAHLAAKGDTRVQSATFLTTLIDFATSGDINVFIDEQQLQALEQKMAQKGVLNGRDMATSFNMLRANELIWSFVVNNYLMGKDPFPFDLLYWSDDSTSMPAAMHSFYLRNIYLENNLVKKDKLTLLGTPIDISKIAVPTYMTSTLTDHITPWQGCFAPLHKFKGDVRFVLGNSGHVAGAINPPSRNKGYFYTAPIAGEKSAEKWFNKAQAHKTEVTWWLDWKTWIQKQSGAKGNPAPMGSIKYAPIEPAPGRYVRETV